MFTKHLALKWIINFFKIRFIIYLYSKVIYNSEVFISKLTLQETITLKIYKYKQ